MALDNVPWFMSNPEALHSGAVARTLGYAATAGANGVVSPTDMRVTALPTPGAAVRVFPGAAVLLNQYPGASNQSYVARNATATDVPVVATGSSGGATRFLILRVIDPEFGGQAPANPATGPYVRFEWVTSITGLAYPHVVLCRLVMPANTATITGAMITDLRDVANPRQLQVVRSGPVTKEVRLQNTTGIRWPDFRPQVAIPTWATHVNIITTISSVGHLMGDTDGILTTTIGEAGATQFRATNTSYDLEQGPNEGERHTFVIGGEGALNPALRGTTQVLATEGRMETGPGYLITKGGTHVIYQVTFMEKAG